MLAKKIKYEDFNGVEREETFYFNLTKAELMELELSTTGGFEQMVTKVNEAKDTPTITKIFKDFILKTYGVKSPDGRSFLKEDDNGRPLYKDFISTNAYSVLFMELSTDAKAAADFMNGVVPADLAAKSAELAKANTPAIV